MSTESDQLLAELNAVHDAAKFLAAYVLKSGIGTMKLIGREDDKIETPKWMVLTVVGEDLAEWMKVVEAAETEMEDVDEFVD